MRISSLQLQDLDTKKFSTQSSQILSIFFLSVYLYWPACRHDLKNNTHKKHKVSRHVQSTKMLIKSTKMFVDIFNIHTCKCKNIRVYLSSYCALRNWLFLHTYASSKKKLYTVRKLSPKLS